MPKRSNDFQKLIYLIHHQLTGEAVVTESKFLHDNAANIEREVNIVIETRVGDLLGFSPPQATALQSVVGRLGL